VINGNISVSMSNYALLARQMIASQLRAARRCQYFGTVSNHLSLEVRRAKHLKITLVTTSSPEI